MAVKAKTRIDSRTSSRLAGLYEAHATDAYRLALLLTRDPSTAEDILQEAFVKLAGRFSDLRHPDRFGGYLYRTILNLSRSLARRRMLERRSVEKRRQDEIIEPDRSASIGDRDALWRGLIELPKRQRAVLFFRYYLGLSESEAADAMDCSLSAIKSLKLRAMRRLADEMGGARDG